MPARIGPRRPPRTYLAEWRAHIDPNLTQKRLGERVGVSDVTIYRWETGESLMNTGVMAAVAEALGIDMEDLLHHPDTPTPNRLLREAPPHLRAGAMEYLALLAGRKTGS